VLLQQVMMMVVISIRTALQQVQALVLLQQVMRQQQVLALQQAVDQQQVQAPALQVEVTT
jgi:hypothetical protein